MVPPILRFCPAWLTRRRLSRRLLVGVVAATVVCSALPAAASGAKGEGGFAGNAPTEILIEASTGAVLFEKNADELRPPASMMKLMTVEVVFHALKQGKLKLTDEYPISEYAWRHGGAPSGTSTMFASIHSNVSVADLLQGAIVDSGNDACIALAEGMAGNEQTFVSDFMTRRARELGLTKSTFANSNGLPAPNNQMTVRELAMLARHIILTYPELYKLFSEKAFTWNKIRQRNRNPLLNAMEGADGLKTGYTKEGGYGLVGSVVQNGVRLIVVVNGLTTKKERASEASKLLEWGFHNFAMRRLFAAREPLGYAKVFDGNSRSVAVTSPKPIQVMVHKGGDNRLKARVVYTGPVPAPVAAGQRIGVLKVWRGDDLAVQAPVYAAEPIGIGSTMQRAFDGVIDLVLTTIRAGIEKL
jgi:D-alanyl-D-alanine carboxypeptidase (penicillin-binding protein 5/6)